VAVRTEDEALVRHEQTKQKIEAEIQDAETSVENLKTDLAQAKKDLDDQTAKVDKAKKEFNKAAKVVDQALKDIATKACETPAMEFHRDAHSFTFRMLRSRSSVWSVRPSTDVVGWTKLGSLC